MTADLLVATQIRRQTPADADRSEQYATAAVGHPGGNPWHLWPVDHGVEIRIASKQRAQAPRIGGQTVRIAAGAAVFNVRLAIATLGYRPVQRCCQARPFRPSSRFCGAARRRTRRRWSGRSPALSFPRGVSCRHLATARCTRRSCIVSGPRRKPRAWLRSVEGPERAVLAERLSAVGMLAPDTRVMAVGSNYNVPVAHLRAGSATQRVVLTTRLLGATAAIVGWPADLLAASPLPPVLGARGLCPQMLIAVGRPVPAAELPC